MTDADKAYLTTIANRLLAAQDPVFLMIMPGCEPVCVNQKHVDQFPATAEFLVKSVDEFIDSVNSALASLDRRDPGVPPLPQYADLQLGQHKPLLPVCLCEKLDAVVALDERDCVFEVMYEGQHPTGFEFNLVDQNGLREYAISTALGRRLDDFKHDALAKHRKGLFEARLLPVGLRAIVADEVDADENPVLKVRVRIQEGGGSYVEPKMVPYPAGLPPYKNISDALDSALELLEKDPEAVDRACRIIWDEVRVVNGSNARAYPTLSTVFLNLFEKPGDEVQHALTDIRRRLWDAPLVARELRRFLRERVDSEEFLADCVKRPVVVQKELIQLGATLEFRERVERFAGAISWSNE